MSSTIRLKPEELSPPGCENFHDEAKVRRFEQAMRVFRAKTEPWVLVRDTPEPDVTWRVAGPSGSSWQVDIVDGHHYDCCECPDFLGNRLGTCKHLEAVRHAIDRRASLRRALTRVPVGNSRDDFPVLTVNGLERASFSAVGDWTAARLRRWGLARDARGTTVRVIRPDALARVSDGDVRITAAAVALARDLTQRAYLTARRESVTEALHRGRMGLDVLSEPLFPYQEDGVRHLLVAGRALLADDMGLGKTVQALAACEALRRRGEAARVLIVTMASLKDQWAREIHRYTGEAAVVVGGSMATRHEAFMSDAPYKILNYELTWRELTRLQRLDADVLVLDEAQRARNFRTRTASTLREIPSKFLFVLTGTPVENRLDDLYSLLQLVDPEVLGPLWTFNLRYHDQNSRGRVEAYKNLTDLRARIAPVVLRRRKDEVLTQLPPLTEQTRYTAMAPAQARLELAMRQDARRLMSIAERRPLSPMERERVMRLLLKARQACNALELCDPRLGERASPKLDEFESLLGEIMAQGQSKVLVFSEWTGMLELAADRLDRLGVRYAKLHGGVPTEKRPALLQKFKDQPDIRVLLSTDAGGVGLNLQVATYVVHLDLPWNPARLDQRTSRAHRLGQTHGVSVTYLCSETGIERGIEGTLAGKRAVRSASLDVMSDVDTVVAPSFSIFLKGLREALEALDTDDVPAEETPSVPDAVLSAVELDPDEILTVADDAPAPTLQLSPPEVSVSTPETPTPDVTAPAVEPMAPTVEVPAPTPTPTPTAEPKAAQRARNRLRMADVLLASGFTADAVGASYEALRAALSALSDGRVFESHAAMVGALYRELIPQGKVAPAVHGVLARLHDVATLDAHGVEVDEALAREAVREAGEWVDRLAPNG